MGRKSITPNNEVQLFEGFPRLKFDNPKEKKLITCHEDPSVVYVHTLKRPKLVNGKPVMVTKENKDKTKSWEENDMDFVSRPMCLGDEAILEERGLDIKNCPACAVAKTKPDHADKPQRRYAMHVFEYATKSGSYDLSSPFGGKVVVWTFNDRTFNKLIEVVKDTEKALKENDLQLECVSKEYQSFDLKFSTKALWKRGTNEAHVETALADNVAKDLDAMAGKSMTRDAIQEDLDAIEEAWRMANGQADDITEADKENLNANLKDVLNGARGLNAASAAGAATAPTSEPESTDSADEDSAPETPVGADGVDGFKELLALRGNK